MKFEKSPTSSTDRLCAAALAGLLVATTVIYEATDGRAIREAAALDKLSVTAVGAASYAPIVETLVDHAADRHMESVPLSRELQTALWEACAANGVPLCLALGVMEVESAFRPEAVNGVCYGLMQLNERYFPANLSPADNIRAGVAYLGELLERYGGDTAKALTAYNAGHDTGSRTYANAVLAAAEKWGCG